MQLGIDSFNSNPNFTGIKMTRNNINDANKLYRNYLKKPNLQTRDKIVEILDPYIQKKAMEISGDKYYYDDVLQNMRLNLLEMLERRQVQHSQDSVNPIILTVRRLKANLFHKPDSTQNALKPQKDENLVPWHTLSKKNQEKFLPADRLERQHIAETADMYIYDTPLNNSERGVLKLIYKNDMDTNEIGNLYNLTARRINGIKNSAIKHIQQRNGIEPKN